MKKNKIIPQRQVFAENSTPGVKVAYTGLDEVFTNHTISIHFIPIFEIIF